MTAVCYWALLKHDEESRLERAAAAAASRPAEVAWEALCLASSLSSSPGEDLSCSPSPPSVSRLFHLLDAALRGFLSSSRCLTRDSERYSVEARSLASSGDNFEAAFNFLGRALEAAAISKAMSELEASRGGTENECSSSSPLSSSVLCCAAAAASVAATTDAFSSHVARCSEASKALAKIRRAQPAAYAVLSQVMAAKAAAPPPPVPLFNAAGASSAAVAAAAAVASAFSSANSSAAAAKPPSRKPETQQQQLPPQRSLLTDALRDRLKALAAGAGCLPTWPPRGASKALLC